MHDEIASLGRKSCLYKGFCSFYQVLPSKFKSRFLFPVSLQHPGNNQQTGPKERWTRPQKPGNFWKLVRKAILEKIDMLPSKHDIHKSCNKSLVFFNLFWFPAKCMYQYSYVVIYITSSNPSTRQQNITNTSWDCPVHPWQLPPGLKMVSISQSPGKRTRVVAISDRMQPVFESEIWVSRGTSRVSRDLLVKFKNVFRVGFEPLYPLFLIGITSWRAVSLLAPNNPKHRIISCFLGKDPELDGRKHSCFVHENAWFRGVDLAERPKDHTSMAGP